MGRITEKARLTGKQIQAIRHALGENTAKFGERLAVSGRTIEDWEQSRREPRGLAKVVILKLGQRTQAQEIDA
jgi:DNA-binding transcriptional regulator YiaG